MQQLQTPFIASWIVYLCSPFFLPVRLGGDGFLNSEATREAAYAASMIYCGPMMRNAVPTLDASDLVA